MSGNEGVTGSYNRVYYKRPRNDMEKFGKVSLLCDNCGFIDGFGF